MGKNSEYSVNFSKVEFLDKKSDLEQFMKNFFRYPKIFCFCFSAKWNGITVADLVFPWFMWIMGVSMAISIQSQLRNSMTRKRMVFNIAKRSLILFSLGLIINSIGNFTIFFKKKFDKLYYQLPSY